MKLLVIILSVLRQLRCSQWHHYSSGGSLSLRTHLLYSFHFTQVISYQNQSWFSIYGFL